MKTNTFLYILRLALTLLAITAIMAAALAGVNKLTKDRIAAVEQEKKEEAIRYRRRQYLYSLRSYERKGKELAASGITIELLEKLDNECNED